MRIAFHVPRASFLTPGLSGDKVLVRGLMGGLIDRGHQVRVVSNTNLRDFSRGKLSWAELAREIVRAGASARRFSPDAWLVYGAAPLLPDFIGWWQSSARYVLYGPEGGSSDRGGRMLSAIFGAVHRRSLRRAGWVVAFRPSAARRLLAEGVPRDRLAVLPPPGRTWDELPSRVEARGELEIPLEATVGLCYSEPP